MIAKLFSNTSTENVMPVSATETLNDNVSEQNSYDTDEESNADESVNILDQSLYFYLVTLTRTPKKNLRLVIIIIL